MWQQGATLELEITDVSNSGEGVGRYQDRVVFVPNTVTGDLVRVRLEYLKDEYARAIVLEILNRSQHRTRARCIVADKCGGCQWQHINDQYQGQLKEDQLKQALKRIGQLDIQDFLFSPILKSTESLGYRNRVTYPLGKSSTGSVQAGYYQPKSHHLVNLNQCPVQDVHFNPLLAEIKQDIQQQNWSIYDEKTHLGLLRHLSLRIGRRTGEVLLTLVSSDGNIPNLQEQAQQWLIRYPNLIGVNLNLNKNKGNSIFGTKTYSVAGRPYVREIFADLELHLGSDTFFQINTEMAELVLQIIIQELQLKGTETLLDAYCGVGTFTLPIARLVKMAIGIEIQEASLERAYYNANLNKIENVTFYQGKVEEVLPNLEVKPDLIILDPPRKGCVGEVIEQLCELKVPRLVYISCQPPTLARDLKILTQSGNYKIRRIQSADFFPQTTHVESIVFLEG
ncbi:MAG: 23S rRNA (uracil(1939)-C(5))-methyltransferase RlmD [Cyanobacteriota bacterium ELA615]|jgi:23S rRNA (uracil1939-C5)-methyltransferase